MSWLLKWFPTRYCAIGGKHTFDSVRYVRRGSLHLCTKCGDYYYKDYEEIYGVHKTEEQRCYVVKDKDGSFRWETPQETINKVTDPALRNMLRKRYLQRSAFKGIV